MLNIIYEYYSNTPFYTEIYTRQEFEELVRLNLNPVSVRIINEKYTEPEDTLKAKQIFQTDDYRITSKEHNDLKGKINQCYNENVKVALSIVYEKYKDKKNLQAVIFPIN